MCRVRLTPHEISILMVVWSENARRPSIPVNVGHRLRERGYLAWTDNGWLLTADGRARLEDPRLLCVTEVHGR